MHLYLIQSLISSALISGDPIIALSIYPICQQIKSPLEYPSSNISDYPSYLKIEEPRSIHTPKSQIFIPSAVPSIKPYFTQ